MKKTNNYLIITIAVTFVLTSGFGSQTIRADDSQSLTMQQSQAQLEQQLQQIQSQIIMYQQQLAQVKGQKNTLQNKINQLKKQQASLQLQIQATNLQLQNLTTQMTSTQTAISQKQTQSQQIQSQIAGVLQALDQQDNYPLVYVAVSQTNLSDTINQIENYSQISGGLENLLKQNQQLQTQLQQQIQTLTSQQQDTQNFLSVQSLQEQQLAGTVSQQNTLLQQTKGQESNYQIVISDTEQQAAAIANQIYQLLGVSNQITFGQALQVAQWASGATGVPPAFLLAILTQESNLGKNVGTCNRPGDPPSKSWKVIMKPDRDQQPFLQITQSLGMDPDVTPVSCPMHDKNGKQVGWGGAMGPAQFIPSTWVGYAAKVAALTGKPMANPWDIRDAFAAAAIKLKAGGADGTRIGEWNAAMRYFSGSTNPQFSFYGDNVLSLMDKYQSDIDQLGN